MAVLIKRYANRKLYNTQSSRYITLKGIADLLEAGEDVRVIDNESGEDITSITLSQILVDTERANRAVSGNLISGLFQRGGDALYEALSRSTGVHIIASTGMGPEELLGGYFLTPQTNPPTPWPAEKFADLFAREVSDGMVVPRVERRGQGSVR